MDLHSPAMMSPGSFPFRCSVTILLFINTVHRLPSFAGLLESKAVFAISSTGILSEAAKFSRKDPQPEEQASFTTMLVMIPSFRQIAFISCPPISRIKEAPGTYLAAALA